MSTVTNPTMLSLSFSYLLQGVLLVQTINYAIRSWRIDALGTRTIVSLVFVLSFAHSLLLLLSVSLNVARLSAASTLAAQCLSVAALYFFALRVYHLPWRYEFLFLPLVFLLIGSVGTAVGSFLATPESDISHKLVIVSAVFPFLLSAWSTGCILGYHLSVPKSIKQTPVPRPHLILHTALPGTLLLLLTLIGAVVASELNAVAVQVAGYVQAICALWVLENRPLRNIGGETNPEIDAPRILKDLLWTRIRRPASPATIPRRVTLLPLHMGSMGSQDVALAPVTGSDKSFWFSHAFALTNDEHSDIKSPIPLGADPFSRPGISSSPASRGPSLDRSHSTKSVHLAKSLPREKMTESAKSIDARSIKSIPRSVKSVYSTVDSISPVGSIPIALAADVDGEVETTMSHDGHSTAADSHSSPSPSHGLFVSIPISSPAAVYVSPGARPSSVGPSVHTVQVTPRPGTPTIPPTPRRSASRSTSTQRSLLPVTPRSATFNVPSPARSSPASSGRSHTSTTSSLPKRAPLPASFARLPPTPHARSGSGLTFMPPGLYDPREFQAIRGKREGSDGEAV
ncbi:hypothetical protein BU17DRAFT_61144 [Hysterangium stoloniferum]|nr:hypothetical protein BU17DRAFT_61144 [Hysterangium stoloniferum]